MGLQLALVPILAAHWGLERFGLWGMLIAVPGLLLLTDLGFATAATVRMTMQIARGQQDAARVTMHSASQVVLFASTAVLLAGACAATLLPDAASDAVAAIPATDLREAILCLAGYSALILGSGLLQAVFRSNGRFALGSLLSTMTLLLESALLVAAVVTGHGIATAAAALLIGRATGLLLAWVMAGRLRTGMLPGLRQRDHGVRRELLGPALAAMAIPLALTLIVQGQVIALGMVAGAAAVPAFVAARTLSRLGLQLSQALAHPLMPEFAALAANDNRSGMVRYFVLVLTVSLAISAAAAITLALAGAWIIEIWSGGHIIVPPGLMPIIAISALCGGIWNPVSNLILAINQQARFAPILLILANMGLFVTLASGAMLGSNAAALSIALVDLAVLAIVMRFAHTHWAGPSEWRRAAVALAKSELPRLFRRA